MKVLHKLLTLVMVLAMIFSFSVTAFAAPVDEATIDPDRDSSITIYKYDLTSAEIDGIWDSSYVSTGVRDEAGVESLLGDPERISPLTGNGDAYGYAVKGCEFTYLRLGDAKIYTTSDENEASIELLYGIPSTEENNALFAALGIRAEDRVEAADEDGVYFFRSDTLIDALENALTANATKTKDALERYIEANGGVAMPLTNEYGYTKAENLKPGLFLILETRVPETVTSTTSPFFVSLPMTSVDGGNASDGGTRWIYDITVYPKDNTGVPSLEKTLRESKNDTGKNNASQDITDGYAHTGTASAGDVIDYQLVSTLPSITSKATYLSEYSFLDKLSKGLSYTKGDVTLEFFRDTACTDKIAAWTEKDEKFTVSYNDAADNGSTMTITMTPAGLTEINESQAVYTDPGAVDRGYSRCTLRITYKAAVHSDATVVYGDQGNPNSVVLTWRRSSTAYYDTLVDDCHLYVYSLDITKRFSDGRGNYGLVEFVVHNDTDNVYLIGELNADEGVWHVTGHTDQEAQATHFKPTDKGKLIIKGVEDDVFTMTEVQTDSSYTMLKKGIPIVIKVSESDELCGVYSSDEAGLLQNDPRYAGVEENKYPNLPQRHLEHHTLTASATVDGKQAAMTADGDSAHAFVPFTVVNSRGFNLPQTGSHGTWMFPVIGLLGLTLAVGGIWLLLKKKPTASSGK